MSSFMIRLRSSIILMAITIAVLAFGGPVLFAAAAAISMIGLYELYKVYGIWNTPLSAVGLAGAALYYVLLFLNQEQYLLLAVLVTLLMILAVYVLTFPRYKADKVAEAFFGMVYVAVMISFIYRTRCLEGGAYLVWLIFIASWGSDTMAYCTGILIGKHKLAPVLSPKKSIEGSVGGILGAALIGALYGIIFSSHITVLENPVLSIALIGGLGSIVSQIGDLAASAIKRNYDIKDYGTLIPGHGGIMDRFDSVIITAPITYYLIHIMAGL